MSGIRRDLNPADLATVAYLTVIVLLSVIFFHRVPLWWAIWVGHGLAIALIIHIAERSKHFSNNPAPSRLFFIRSWYPVVLIPLVYKELEYLIPRIHPRDYDRELAAIDYAIFGAHPTVWLERMTHPALTEIFQLSYITYYFLPLVLGAVLWRRRELDRFHFLLFVIVLGFYLSYLGYIAVPAIGPRFILADQQTFSLSGILFFDFIRATLDRAEGITRDCFPSGHTELTLVVLYYSYRFHRRTFWSLIAPGSLLIISTVYLRYHYVIDVLAGALLALAVIAVAKPLYRALGGLWSEG
ncbi:MAG: phosphatase PAP2 family protein, partial [Acidobacteriota bacterium]